MESDDIRLVGGNRVALRLFGSGRRICAKGLDVRLRDVKQDSKDVRRFRRDDSTNYPTVSAAASYRVSTGCSTGWSLDLGVGEDVGRGGTRGSRKT